MDKKLTAKIELLGLLKDNDGFRITFKNYLGEVFKSSRELRKRNMMRIHCDLECAKFTADEIKKDGDFALDDNSLYVIDISKDDWNTYCGNSIKFAIDSVNLIIKRLQEEIKCEEDNNT